MPEAFTALTGDKPATSAGHHTGLTREYASEIAAKRHKPIDASRYSGLTRKFIEENQRRKP
jgi:hypothetical protein